MKKPWPAKRQRVRLGARAIKGTDVIENVPKPRKNPKKKKEKKPEVVEEKQEETKEEEPQEETTEESEPETEEETGPVKKEGFDLDKVKGTVKFFNKNKGFGFILGDEGREYYVNEDGLKGDITIESEDKVSFKFVKTDKGFKAVDVEKEG